MPVELLKPTTPQQFLDQVGNHLPSVEESVERLLPPKVADLAFLCRRETRKMINIPPEALVIIFGEQAYGLNEPPKVIGKRVFACTLGDSVVPLEMFATFDVVGSEAGIYRMQIPNPSNPEGYTSLTILKDHKRRPNAPTNGFRAPTIEELEKVFATLAGSYGLPKSETLKEIFRSSYEQRNNPNYALANVDLLRRFEKAIGLQIENYLTEDTLDTILAQNGGMELMFFLWPTLVIEANKHPFEGVRTPAMEETPFQLYHQERPDCLGRMRAIFVTNPYENSVVHLDTPITATCMECDESIDLTAQQILEEKRKITWRAIPRVILYSTTCIDGHISGGGSIYNQQAKAATTGIGLPYFPLTWMEKGPRGIFVYNSAAFGKAKDENNPGYTFVHEGKAAMVDLLLSAGTAQIKQSIAEAIQDPSFSTSTRISCPRTLGKKESIADVDF
jgi:hypothetical protein